MNKSTITIFFILFSMTLATKLRSLEWKVTKTNGFLWIFKYSNFEPIDTTEDGTKVVNSKQATYEWYVWGGYQDKFADGVYGVQFSTQVNGGNVVAQELATFAETQNKNELTVNNFKLPEECKVTKDYSYTVKPNGWTEVDAGENKKKSAKQILISFTCDKKSSKVENQSLIKIQELNDMKVSSSQIDKQEEGVSKVSSKISEVLENQISSSKIEKKQSETPNLVTDQIVVEKSQEERRLIL